MNINSPMPLYLGGFAFSSSCSCVLTYSVGKVMQISMPPAIPPETVKTLIKHRLILTREPGNIKVHFREKEAKLHQQAKLSQAASRSPTNDMLWKCSFSLSNLLYKCKHVFLWILLTIYNNAWSICNVAIWNVLLSHSNTQVWF